MVERLCRLDPDNSVRWLSLAKLALKSPLAPPAIGDCLRVIELIGPDDPVRREAELGAARGYNDIGHAIHALDMSERVLAYELSNVAAWYERARSLHRLGLYADALFAVHKVIDLDPSRAGVWQLRGRCQQLMRVMRERLGPPVRKPFRLALGEAVVESIIDQHGISKHVARLVVDAMNSAEGGRIADAEEFLTEATELDSSFALAWLLRARCYHFRRSFSEAEPCYERSLEISASTEARVGLASCLLGLKRPTEALAGFERVLDAQPDSADALHGRALALEALGRPEEAEAAFDRYVASASRERSMVLY